MGLVSKLKASEPPPAYTVSAPAQGDDVYNLGNIVSRNGLQCFYPPNTLTTKIEQVASLDFQAIANELRVSKEVATALAPLSLYDVVLLIDDSGSMLFEENGERIDDLKFVLSKLAPIVSIFDDDGISVRFLNDVKQVDNIRTAVEVQSLISQVRFSGATPLGTVFERKIVMPMSQKPLTKPLLCIILTDGEPTSEPRRHFVDVMCRTKDWLQRSQYGQGALAVQIAQLGKDSRAQKFLGELDNHPRIGDMIDATSYYELEAEEFKVKGMDLTPEMWLMKLCLGSIDPDLDAKD